AVWCQLGHMPLREMVPSVLWFVLKGMLFLVGALVYWKRPGDASAAQFYLLCVVTLCAYMGGYHWSHITPQPLLLLVFMVCAVWYLGCISALLHSFWTVSDLTERNQVKSILVGFLLALPLIGYSFYLVVWQPDDFAEGAVTWPMFFASALITLAFAVSITRYR